MLVDLVKSPGGDETAAAGQTNRRLLAFEADHTRQ